MSLRLPYLQLLAGILLALASAPIASGQDPIISEFLAANANGLRDSDGDASDWIEIFNPSSNEVSMAGWGLSDDPDSPRKWTFPAVNIPGNGFLLVFASGKDRTDPVAQLHSNFSLDRDGEYLALTRPDASIAYEFSPQFPPQIADVSHGLRVIVDETSLVSADSPARFLAPEDDSFDAIWRLPAFDDSSWSATSSSIGYDHAEPGGEFVLADSSLPTDAITGTSSNSPAGEEVDKAIDGSPDTKYLNLDKLDAGLTVSLSRGPSAVIGLRFTSANDAPQRDPTSFDLLGSNDGSNFTPVASGAIPDFTDRFQTVSVEFGNEVSYRHYRLVFPTVRDAANAVAMQIAEVEFLALISSAPPPEDDVSAPDDGIQGSSTNWPNNEEVDKVIDNNPATKYLNFDKLNAGFTVTPSLGTTVVSGLRLTSANDSPDRDPTSFVLSGSVDGVNFTNIASGAIPDFTARFQTVQVVFPNFTAYQHYRLIFPTVRDAASAVAMQIAEVEFLGYAGLPPTAFTDLIGTEINGGVTSAYLRVPFTINAGQLPEIPALRIWHDDGFIAHLNGIEIARANAPQSPQWNSLAPLDRQRSDSIIASRFDLSAFAAQFVEGRNVLAIHGLNVNSASDEFLLRAELIDSLVSIGDGAFFTTPKPGAANGEGSAGIIDVPSISAGRGFYDAPLTVELSTTTPDATIRYTLDGSEPTATSGTEFTAPINMAETTVLRAAAFRDDWLASKTVTHTYLFPADVLAQTQATALADGLPASWNGQAADYGLDSRVILGVAELTTLPSISLVMDPEEMFGSGGIYANPNSRGASWEREVSFEWIDPNGSADDSFHEQAGVRIQGGAFRRFDLTLKKSFRMIFRERYGAPRLQRSIFGPEAAAEVDSFTIRANGNDAWIWGGSSTQYVRDAFSMETMRAMGNVASHSSFAHLYINGQYWGLYNPAERPDAAFSSIYHGGDQDSWDALNQDSVPDGNADAWNRLVAQLNAGLSDDAAYQKILGNNPDGTRNLEYEVLLDVDNMIDYMMLNFYTGNADWPGRNHWYGINREGDQGFQFYPWDSETALGLGSNVNSNRTGVTGSIARPYAACRANAQFRARFGDRVHQQFFNGGVFYVNPQQPAWDPAAPENNRPAQRYAALAEKVDAAIAAESARWGDQRGASLYTRDSHWRPQRDSLFNSYFPQRSAIVLDQLRAAGLYPNVDAPVFNLHGGAVPVDFPLTMTGPGGGTIFYTTDGSDPRGSQVTQVVSTREILPENHPLRVLVPTAAVDPLWRSELGFDDSSWRSGSGGIGYDTGNDYQTYIDVDLESDMRLKQASAFIRIEFNYQPEEGVTPNALSLLARTDDGFIAYLNGVQIAAFNAPESPAWDATATGNASDPTAVQWVDYDASDGLGSLVAGQNLLALQALNVSTGSSDFLFEARLEIGERELIGDPGNAQEYTGAVALGDLVTVKARTLEGGEWSALNEATFVVGSPLLTVSELDYHPADPSAAEIAAGFDDADDFEFIELYNPSAQTFDLRGVRFIDGVEFEFTGSAVEQLPGGARLLIVNKADAFAMRYGNGIQFIAGEYRGRFANSGEHVEAVDAQGVTIIEFAYSDASPWPTEADGNGPSLELRQPDADPADHNSWTASVARPTPGEAPSPPAATYLTIATEAGGELVLRFTAEAGIAYEVQQSGDLIGGWTQLQSIEAMPESGPAEARFTVGAGETRRFYRVIPLP